MGTKMISSMIPFLNCLTVFLVVQFADAQAVQFPGHSNSRSCPGDNSRCIDITLCDAARKNIRIGKNPIVSGWKSDVPQVCCPEEDKIVIPKQQMKISRLSHKGCGIKSLPRSMNEYISPTPLTDDGAEIIEPRRPSNLSAKLEVPDLLPNGNFQFAVGGQNAPIPWPWMVAIFNGNAQRQLCGGTLIDERHVVTAAHCFVGKSLDPNLYSVQVGVLVLSESNTKYAVKDIKLHEGYMARYYYDDIAILKLAEPFTSFTAACLPADDYVHHGDNVTVLGWGDLSYGGPSTQKLQEVPEIPVVGNARCDAKFRTLPGAPFPRGITDTFLCAGLEEGGKDACQGDSGGPLLFQHPEGPWTLVGVVSFGYQCGEPEYPGVYTKVSAYLPWIEKIIGHQNEVETKANSQRSQRFMYIDNKPIWKSVTERVLFPS